MPSENDSGVGAKPGRRKISSGNTPSATAANPFGPGKDGNSFAVLPDVANYRLGASLEPASPVDRSREIAGHFMAATQLINPLIERAEKALAALRLGVSASVSIQNADDGWISVLCFEKAGSEWVLVHDEGHANDPASWKSTRLTATSRATRLKCLRFLPELEKALVEKAEAELQMALGTVSDAEAYLAELEARAK